MMAAGLALGFRDSLVGRIAVQVLDHETGAVAYFGLGMSGRLVQEMDDGFQGCLGSAFLQGSQNIECVEHGSVNSPGGLVGASVFVGRPWLPVLSILVIWTLLPY
jgi:hypothetical protein